LCLLVSSALVSPVAAGAQVAGADPQPNASAAPARVDDLLPETQRGIHGAHYTGLVWWIPPEFWEISMAENGATPAQIAEFTKPLRDYTLVAVVVGKVGALGSIDFTPADALRSSIVLRDAHGTEYPQVTTVSDAAAMLPKILKPVFSNIAGKMGDNIEVLYFPAKSKSGALLADASSHGEFSIVLRNLTGSGDSVYLWRLPLSSVQPAKYCPVGKERVEANWNYCPWHGVPLNSNDAAKAKQP
jgi:hypothetical protein